MSVGNAGFEMQYGGLSASANCTLNASDGSSDSQDIPVSGAALGDLVLVSVDADVTDGTITADVTSADTVTVVLNNNSGSSVDLSSSSETVYVVVIQKV